ncbi:hypothetical protein BDW59DRAFT_139495 [Aspergillus cavernicola]|uniref:Uncharacterized protein n=1 Tax=Aspergillus cavernicola TaxID=176166 RepID=A0ABR4IY28_9EURO
MHFSTPLKAFLLHLAMGYIPPTAAAGCGEFDACIGTESCTTKTFTSPVSTVITTCVPMPTCIGVYGGCTFGSGLSCCSGYCAATKCRSTDDDWPSCSEDLGPCVVDENCCYGNVCVEGLCVRPPPSQSPTATPTGVCPS